MGKGNDFRAPRRRGFDDEAPEPYAPPRGGPPRSRPFDGPSGGGAPAAGPVVDAVVKWFKSDKGFGFCELADGSGDAFLHINALQSAGFDTVASGARLKVQVGQGAKGAQVTRVVEVDESAVADYAPKSGPRPRAGSPRQAPDMSSAVAVAGVVKWFNVEKGFGFVAGDDGRKDVFVHVTVLNAAGLSQLGEGQRVDMRVVDTPKGREAVSISLAG
jgi:CspA family cold shock protein